MKENWYALFICTQLEMSIDKALAKMNIKFKDIKRQLSPRGSKYSEEDFEKILNLKNNGKSYREISEILGMTPGQAAGALRMYKIKATKNPDQSVQSSIPKNSPSLYHMEGGMQ